MCSSDIVVKSEPVEESLSSSTRCEHQGAKAEHDAFRPPTPSKPNLRPMTTKVEEDGDDVLTSLCALFDGMWDDDSDDDSDTKSDIPEPQSPRSRGGYFLFDSHFFYGNRQYSYDQDHNVFLLDDFGVPTQIHEGRFVNLDETLLDFERITGLPYFFNLDGTLCHQEQGLTYPVPVWPYTGTDPTMSAILPNTTLDLIQNSLVCGPNFETDAFNPDPLQGSLQGQMNLSWSPSSLTLSPIVSVGSRASSSEPGEPLIPVGSYYPLPIQTWKEEIGVIQQERKPLTKLERRRCRHCGKVFRRPSSMEDHANIHTGAKPHVCPYEKCCTGFATKSNMKRHFITHRVGKLEEYVRGSKSGSSLTATYNARAFHTQRYRLV